MQVDSYTKNQNSMEDLLEKIIPVVLCLGGIYYFWYSSRKGKLRLEKTDNRSEMVEYAMQLLADLNLESDVIQELVKNGCRQDNAEAIVTEASYLLAKKAKRTKIQYFAFGLLFAIGGLVITIWSYINATAHGGTYYITWGAIVFGGYLLYKGLENV